MTELPTKEQFQSFVESVYARPGCKKPIAFGLGIAAANRHGKTLEVFYPAPHYQQHFDLAAILYDVLAHRLGNTCCVLSEHTKKKIRARSKCLDAEPFASELSILNHPTTKEQIVVTILTENLPPTSVAEAYLMLALLSARHVKPNQLNLSSIFSVLPTVAWTSSGAIDPEELPQRILEARLAGEHLEVYSIDKFPKLINYLAPSKVRIADGARVRLGAYLGEGTTVMHEGFINFNAGTEGPNMVEGRISAGVYVERGSDLGGGSSTMGRLSGGNEVLISIGKNCLIGANAGTGIPLGDNCIIEAGLYVTASTKVELVDEEGKVLEVAKARDLSLRPNLLFRRNSLTGAVQALPNKKAVKLNEELHS